MLVQPYLCFEGRTEEALEFYREVLGAEMQMLMRYKDNPDPTMGGSSPGDKVMHSSFRVGDTTLMASDGYCSGKANFQGITLSISVTTDADAERIFAALGEGGTVHMPLATTFFSSRFGMLSDRFGVPWMILVVAS